MSISYRVHNLQFALLLYLHVWINSHPCINPSEKLAVFENKIKYMIHLAPALCWSIWTKVQPQVYSCDTRQLCSFDKEPWTVLQIKLLSPLICITALHLKVKAKYRPLKANFLKFRLSMNVKGKQAILKKKLSTCSSIIQCQNKGGAQWTVYLQWKNYAFKSNICPAIDSLMSILWPYLQDAHTKFGYFGAFVNSKCFLITFCLY